MSKSNCAVAIAASLLASGSSALAAPPAPLAVKVTNPVLPVEISNAQPITVEVRPIHDERQQTSWARGSCRCLRLRMTQQAPSSESAPLLRCLQISSLVWLCLHPHPWVHALRSSAWPGMMVMCSGSLWFPQGKARLLVFRYRISKCRLALWLQFNSAMRLTSAVCSPQYFRGKELPPEVEHHLRRMN